MCTYFSVLHCGCHMASCLMLLFSFPIMMDYHLELQAKINPFLSYIAFCQSSLSEQQKWNYNTSDLSTLNRKTLTFIPWTCRCLAPEAESYRYLHQPWTPKGPHLPPWNVSPCLYTLSFRVEWRISIWSIGNITARVTALRGHISVL